MADDLIHAAIEAIDLAVDQALGVSFDAATKRVGKEAWQAIFTAQDADVRVRLAVFVDTLDDHDSRAFLRALIYERARNRLMAQLGTAFPESDFGQVQPSEQ